MIKFTIPGQPVTKKNSQRLVRANWPERCFKRITTMDELNKTIAV